MIYEIRHYTLFDGKFEDMMARFKEVNLPLFRKYGITVDQTWSHPDDRTKFSFLMSFTDEHSRKKSWQQYHEDETFLAGRETQKSIIEHIEWHVLNPVHIAD